MPRLLHLLLVVCVLWCGAHVAEPVQAHDEAMHHTIETGHAGEEPEDAHEGAVGHAVQHHCPVAPDQGPVANPCPVEIAGAAHFAAPVTALTSLTRAPPLEPPAA